MYFGWRPYVPVAKRRAASAAHARRLAKKRGKPLSPVEIRGRAIATTFWGKAWCENLESYSDYENRLPRGRTYARNGSVIDLTVAPGAVTALVSGSSLYTVEIRVKAMNPTLWAALVKQCSGSIGSLIELLQGKLSSSVMRVLTEKTSGFFPAPKEISMTCSCPDWATMCKHCAAVLYGIGNRIDVSPEILFTLRKVKHEDLLAMEVTPSPSASRSRRSGLSDAAVSDLFGIEIDEGAEASPPKALTKSKKEKKPVSKRRNVKPGSRRSSEATAKAERSKKKKPAAKANARAKPTPRSKTSSSRKKPPSTGRRR